MLTLMTGQMNKVKGRQDIALDITVKSGDKVFAPSWSMVMGYKDGKVSEQMYTDMYTEMMRASLVAHRDRWLEVVNSGEVLLLCYCPAGSFCHRHLLADMLKALAESQGIEVDMKGEL